jgi:hypothetical protein
MTADVDHRDNDPDLHYFLVQQQRTFESFGPHGRWDIPQIGEQ